tara:strand:+ start:377 stop:979 length:603 start_codon:yes stop_codon:yes gene_type:complete
MYLIDETDILRYTEALDMTRHHYPYMLDDVVEQMGIVEFKIQKWWSSKIDLIGKSVNIFSSGFGMYSVPLANEKGASWIRTYDKCPIMTYIITAANEVIPNADIKHKRVDFIFNPEEIKNADVWINTSCEHTYPMGDMLPKDKLCVMSGNNLNKPGHINQIESLDQLKSQCNLKTILNEDVMIFERDNKRYNQYFIIGVK